MSVNIMHLSKRRGEIELRQWFFCHVQATAAFLATFNVPMRMHTVLFERGTLMRRTPSKAILAKKQERASKPQQKFVATCTYVEPKRKPLPTAEELAKTAPPLPYSTGNLLALRRACRPKACTVSYTHYSDDYKHGGDQRVSHLRLSGLWLEQLGFAIGSKLSIRARDGELVIAPRDMTPAE